MFTANTPIVECVPNFSEGRDLNIIRQITDAIESVEGIKLLDVDPGAATNRTVVTFIGTPDAVLEAAFRGMKKAAELIDMRSHKGAHPRFGATDVCPLVPVANISLQECAALAHQLAERVGKELHYPVYMYEAAATKPARKSLPVVRSGEYEGLAAKLQDPEWQPDYGPAVFVPQTGTTAIGARDFLIALNFNLNTTSTRRANAVAFDVREAGRVIKSTDPNSGVETETRQPGLLKATKAIGWFIEEYGIAQVSMNINDISITSVHHAFEAVSNCAQQRGLRVSGTEIVGLIPKRVLTDAGKYFLHKQERSTGVSDAELIKIAITSLGLSDLKPFEPEKKVIEYQISDASAEHLVSMSVKNFALETSCESPAPGGGSIAAYSGALAAALGTMVANLSSHKRGWDDQWGYFSDWADEGMKLQTELLRLVDEDTRAFNKIMDAFGLPKGSDTEKAARSEAIQAATIYAAEIPLQVMRTAFAIYPLLEAMVERGNQNSVSDAGVGALCAETAVLGAGLNVKINAKGIKDKDLMNRFLQEAESLEQSAIAKKTELLLKVNQAISNL